MFGGFQLTQHTPPTAKFRVSFDASFCVDRWASLVKKMPFLQYHQDTTGTLPRHHGNTQNMNKTPKTSPDTVKTLWTHHQSATKTPTTTETKLTDHQDTSTQFPKGPATGFSQTVVANILCHDHFPHHHLLPSPSTQQRHNNVTTTSSQHQHQHQQQQHHHHQHHHHHRLMIPQLIFIGGLQPTSLFRGWCYETCPNISNNLFWGLLFINISIGSYWKERTQFFGYNFAFHQVTLREVSLHVARQVWRRASTFYVWVGALRWLTPGRDGGKPRRVGWVCSKPWPFRTHGRNPHLWAVCLILTWVCLKMGYTPNYSHLVGIMIINHWV